MRTNLYRHLVLAGLVLATAMVTATDSAVADGGTHRTPSRYYGMPNLQFLPNFKSHTVQEKLLLHMILNGPGAAPTMIYHTAQEPPFLLRDPVSAPSEDGRERRRRRP